MLLEDSFFQIVALYDAIALFKTYMGKDYRDEPTYIKGIRVDFTPDYNALIKEDEK